MCYLGPFTGRDICSSRLRYGSPPSAEIGHVDEVVSRTRFSGTKSCMQELRCNEGRTIGITYLVVACQHFNARLGETFYCAVDD